jgi:hypothetical protein
LRKASFWLLGWLLSGLVFLALCELGARLAQPLLVRSVPAYYYRQYRDALLRKDPMLVWSGRPGASAEIVNTRGEKISYRMNSLGWRGREFAPLTKPANALLLGDSFTFGLGVAEGSSYSRQLEKSLPGVNVWPFAHMGYAPDQHMLVAQRWLTVFPWAFLVLQFSNNDLLEVSEHEWRKIHSASGIPAVLAPPADHVWFTDRLEFWDAFFYWRRFARQKALGEGELRAGYGRLMFSLEKTLELARERGIPVILLQATDWGQSLYGEKWAADYRAGILSLAGRFGASLVEMQGVDLLPAPDAHWTEASHRLAADRLLAQLKALKPAGNQPRKSLRGNTLRTSR